MKKILYFLVFVTILTVIGCSPNKEVEVLSFDYESNEHDYEFIWSKQDDPYLKRLSSEFHLEELVADSETELEKVMTINHWVHNLWEHDGSNQPQYSDPIYILQQVEQGERFRCVEYATVINGTLNALGIPSRKVGLKTKDVETRQSGAGHVVVEAYLEDMDKWIMVDGQWDVIPVLKETPLNCLELQKALAERDNDLALLSYGQQEKLGYFDWIAEYLYYFDTGFDNRVVNKESFEGLMLVPVGAKEPRIFQKTLPIENMTYTNSVNAFYAKPQV